MGFKTYGSDKIHYKKDAGTIKINSNEYTKYEFKDIINNFIDYRGKTPKKTTCGIPLITAKIVKNGKIEDPTEFISKEDYKLWMTRGFPEINDVVLTTEAPLGEVALIKHKEVALAQRIITLHTNKLLCDSIFLKYYLQSPVGQAILKSRASGSTVEGIKASELKKLIIDLPTLPRQKEIAAVLSTLDDKIEVNQQINKKLEEMAQAIFKQWFIDFNFPDENGNPYKDSGGAMIDSELGQIPAGWTIGAIQNEFNITMGQSPAGSSYNETKNGTLFFQGRTDFNNRFPSNRLFTTEPKRFAKKFDVLLSVRAPVGDINVAIHDCCIGRGLAAVSSQHQSYCYYKINSLKEEFELYNGTGTIFGAINKTQLENIKVIIPPLNTINKVEETINKFDLQIYQKYKEILNLQKIRNILLNRLMSGKIRIQDENQI